MRPVSGGIDFGTSNSTVGFVENGRPRLVRLESGQVTMPSAVFFNFEDNRTYFGRRAIADYTENVEGRLLRALKSVLGTSLIGEKTRIKAHSIAFSDIIGSFLLYLKEILEGEVGQTVDSIVLGRPVHFVDDDVEADRRAQDELEKAALKRGFKHIAFQFEPIAAALDFEQRVRKEELALIIDIGGGTSDFSIVRVSPDRAKLPDRKDDILASSGVHIGGTDFDRLLSIAHVMPELGYLTPTKDCKRNLPAGYFIDLATWQRINMLYTNKAMSDLRQIRYEAARPALVERMIDIVRHRQGHALAANVERAKIALTGQSETAVEIGLSDVVLSMPLARTDLDDAIESAVSRITGMIARTLEDAGLAPRGNHHALPYRRLDSSPPPEAECVGYVSVGDRGRGGYVRQRRARAGARCQAKIRGLGTGRTMELPPALRQAVDQALHGVPIADLKRAADILSQRYRSEMRDGRLHLSDRLAARAYLATRLPATYAAIRASLATVAEVRPNFAPNSLLDIGAGPGSALWAARDCWDSLDEAILVETSEAIRKVGTELSAHAFPTRVSWVSGNIETGLPALPKGEVVTLAYVLDELPPTLIARLVDRLWELTGDTLVVVEPGTPAGWQRILEVRDRLIAAGAYLVAPCPHQTDCPLAAPDWCHFSRRVARSRLHRLAKNAEVPWEDEKYIFIAASRIPGNRPAARVLAPPQSGSGTVRLKLCQQDGTVAEKFASKRQGAAFKAARRLDWGDAV
jgi:hypothetical chaperone protein